MKGFKNSALYAHNHSYFGDAAFYALDSSIISDPHPPWDYVLKKWVIEIGENLTPVTIEFDDDYSVSRKEGVTSTIILCPWNEYFLADCDRYHLKGPLPVNTEERLNAELDEFVKANAEITFSNRKVWMDGLGPRATMQVEFDTPEGKKVGANVYVPIGDALVVLNLLGDPSSLEDQKHVGEMFLKNLALSLTP